MANDIFISYSKPDRLLVVSLSAYLESEGWTVWWDKDHKLGETFRDEIMRELVRARAVIVLWTPNSINSDFVRTEAGRAKADGKLIPVKTSEVAYEDIPLPFGKMHTEDLSKLALIRLAVVAQLAKPRAWWLASPTLRYQALTWFGIIGGAITLFSNLSGVLNLADWAHWLTSHWHEWTSDFWLWTFGWIGINLPRQLTPLFSLAAFCLATAIGARRFVIQKSSTRSAELKNVVFWWLSSQSVATVAFLYVFLNGLWNNNLDYIVYVTLSLLLMILAVVIYKAPVRFDLIIFCIFYMLFYVIIFSRFTTESGFNLTLIGCGLFSSSLPVFSLLMVWICPLRPLTLRLSFLVFGLGLLIGLNELSKYGPVLRALLQPPA